MRPLFILYLFFAIMSFASSESCKDFKKFDTRLFEKPHILKKESFQNYSIGSKNWHQSPLDSFKKHIDGTFLDHLFLKNTQQNKRSLFFESTIGDSVNQSIETLELSCYNENIHPKPYELKRYHSTPAPNSNLISKKPALSFTLLKHEISKAIENLNIAIGKNPAKTLNKQTINPIPQQFSQLFIGSEFWQKDILGSFQALESLRSLQNIFAHEKNSISCDVDLLATPLKQNLTDTFFLQPTQASNLDSNCLNNVQTSISNPPVTNININSTIKYSLNQSEFLTRAHYNPNLNATFIGDATSFASKSNYLNRKEALKKESFSPHMLLSLQKVLYSGQNTINTLLLTQSLPHQSDAIALDKTPNSIAYTINTPTNIDSKHLEHQNPLLALTPIVNKDLKTYQNEFLAKDQKNTLLDKSNQNYNYNLALNHPEAYTSNATILNDFCNLTLFQAPLLQNYLCLNQLYNDFIHSSHAYLFIDCPLDSTFASQISAQQPQNKFFPQIFSTTFSYNFNTHYKQDTSFFSEPLYLGTLAQEQTILNQINYNYVLKNFSLLDNLFLAAFKHEKTLSELPLVSYATHHDTNNSVKPLSERGSPTKTQYLEQDKPFTELEITKCEPFSFDIESQNTSYNDDLECDYKLDQTLSENNSYLSLNVLDKIKTNADLLNLLKNDPANKFICLNTMFESKVQVIPNMNNESHLFRIKIDAKEKQKSLKHTVYFILDHTKDMKKSELAAYKTLISKALSKLSKQKTFFNIILIGNDVLKLHEKNLKPTKNSIHFARKFLDKLTHTNRASDQRVFNVIEKLKSDSVNKNEMSTVLVLSSLKPFSQFAKFRQPIQRITKIKAKNFQLFGFHYGSKNAASGINLLAKLNRGYLVSSGDAKRLYKKSTTLITKIKRPFITDVRLTLADATSKNIKFNYSSDYNPILFSEKPFFIYGQINTLKDVKFILQGKQGHEWVNIVQNIDFKEAQIAQGCLEKRIALENSLFWYARYFNESQPKYLKIAKEKQKPFDIALP